MSIDRNLAHAHALIGLAKYFTGRNDETEVHVLEALRISPREALAGLWSTIAAIAKLGSGHDGEAVALLNRSIELNLNEPMRHFFLA